MLISRVARPPQQSHRHSYIITVVPIGAGRWDTLSHLPLTCSGALLQCSGGRSMVKSLGGFRLGLDGDRSFRMHGSGAFC